ncbi:MAG: hypothetical protein JW839_22365 [Candidatus Lokiarchaeota archaeon]|nr:hypothetical protein [Candidatus Lokiarchaeota archaeon]
MDAGTMYSKNQSARFDTFQSAYEHLGRACSGLERVRVSLASIPGMVGKPLFIPIFSRGSGGAIVAEARLMIKKDRRFGLDRLVLRTVVAARLFNDGERFRVDVLVEGTWDESYWGPEDSRRLGDLHDSLVSIAAQPPSLANGAVPTSMLILSQALSARRGAVVGLVHVKDDLYCVTASTAWRRAHHKDPEIILYYNAADGKVGTQFLKRSHVNALCKAAKAIESVDLDLAEKIAQLKQERLIEQANQRYAVQDTATAMAFQTGYIMSEVDPMFMYIAIQGLDSFGSSVRAAGGSLRFESVSITGAGRPGGSIGAEIGDLFSGDSGDDSGALVIIILIAVVVFLVTAGLVIWGVQKAMTRAERGDASMTYYIGKVPPATAKRAKAAGKGNPAAAVSIHRYRAPRIYADDMKSR